MNGKLLALLFLLSHPIAWVVTHKPIETNIPDNFEFDCNFILSSMIFRYNQRCVQLIVGYEFYSMECIRTVIENNSENVTFYVRSLDWLLNRNIYAEESLSNIMTNQSTRFCENFLIVLRDVSSMQPLLKSLERRSSVATIFPYSRLYFMFTDKNFQFVSHDRLAELTKYFYENAQFAYAYEFNESTRTILLQDILPVRNDRIPFHHPILNRNNDQKEFRLTLYECYPFIIYVDEENLR